MTPTPNKVEAPELLACNCWASTDRAHRQLCPLHGQGYAQPVPYRYGKADDKIAVALSFEGGVLKVNQQGFGVQDGSGLLSFKDDALDWDEEDYRSVKLPSSELIAIRDKLNELWPPKGSRTPDERIAGLVSASNEALTFLRHRLQCADRSGDPCDCGFERITGALQEALATWETDRG